LERRMSPGRSPRGHHSTTDHGRLHSSSSFEIPGGSLSWSVVGVSASQLLISGFAVRFRAGPSSQLSAIPTSASLPTGSLVSVARQRPTDPLLKSPTRKSPTQEGVTTESNAIRTDTALPRRARRDDKDRGCSGWFVIIAGLLDQPLSMSTAGPTCVLGVRSKGRPRREVR